MAPASTSRVDDLHDAIDFLRSQAITRIQQLEALPNTSPARPQQWATVKLYEVAIASMQRELDWLFEHPEEEAFDTLLEDGSERE